MGDDFLDLLAEVPLFETFSRKQLRRVAQAADQIDVEAGRVLMEEGDVGREAFVVVEGELEVRTDGRVLATLGPGAPVGEIALIDEAPRNATVTATKDTSLLVVGQREFAGLLNESPEFARALMMALASRLRATNPDLV